MTNNDMGSHEEPTESEVVHLLGLYADALEQNSSTTPPRRALGDQREGRADMHDTPDSDELRPDVEVVDLEVAPLEEKKAGRGRILVGAVALAAVAAFGGLALTNQNDSSQVDVAEEAIEEDTENTDVVEEDVVEDVEIVEEEMSDAAVTSVATTDSSFGLSDSSVLFTNGEFVSIASSPEGQSLARSSDGLDWSMEPITGFPKNGYPQAMVETDSGWAAVVEVYPEFDEASYNDYGPGPQPERFLAVSTDLVTWTTSEFPDVVTADDNYSYVNGIAASGDQIAILVQNEAFNDEIGVLLELGVITEDDLENFCGTEFADGEAFIAYSCSDEYFEEAMEEEVPADGNAVPTTTVAPADDVELAEDRMGEEEELFRIEPGDVGYGEIAAIYENPNDGPQSIVVVGTIGGEFTSTEIQADGYTNGIAGTDGGFLVIGTSFETGVASVMSSPDGITWSAQTAPAGMMNVMELSVSGSRVLALSQDYEGDEPSLTTHVTDDLGATWASSTIDTALFGAYGNTVGGIAGFAVRVDGSPEPFEDPFADLGELNIVKDGYTMVMDMQTSESSLIGPDGEVIHEDVSPDMAFVEGIENVVRSENFGEIITWLDPTTGEDLVSIGEADFEAAFEEAFGESPFIDEGFEMEQTSETWFSADGLTWTLLESSELGNGPNGYTTVAAIGDDEVLVRSQTFVEPPRELIEFEEEGREPTVEEIDAIDAFMSENSSDEWKAIPIG